jgi:hypothetical protein
LKKSMQLLRHMANIKKKKKKQRHIKKLESIIS